MSLFWARITQGGTQALAATGCAVAFVVSQAWASGATPPGPVAQRCGWFDNPTPGNATLFDRDGEWLVGQQGGHQAAGTWPSFPRSRWVRTGSGSAGYGCACLNMVAKADAQEVLSIRSARVLPLASCRKDPALKGMEPENPLR